MLNRAIEEAHLLQARSHIVAATSRIARQCLIIGRLHARGLSTKQAEACLRTMQETLNAMRAHKALIESVLTDAPAPSATASRVLTRLRAGRRMPS